MTTHSTIWLINAVIWIVNRCHLSKHLRFLPSCRNVYWLSSSLQAEALLPNDSDEGESLSEEDSKNVSAETTTQNTSASTQNTSASTQNTSASTQNTSVSTQNTSSSTQNNSEQSFSTSSQDLTSPETQDASVLSLETNSLSDVETSRGSSGDYDTSIDAEWRGRWRV